MADAAEMAVPVEPVARAVRAVAREPVAPVVKSAQAVGAERAETAVAVVTAAVVRAAPAQELCLWAVLL